MILLASAAGAVQVNVDSNMSFGMIEFAAGHQGDVVLGSNGGVSITGSGLFYLGGAVPGQVTVVGDNGIVEVRCSDTSALEGTDGSTLEVIDIEASVGSGTAAGGGTACNGIATSSPNPIILDLGAFPNPKIYFGGTLSISSDGISGSQTYQSNGGGAPLGVSAVFQ